MLLDLDINEALALSPEDTGALSDAMEVMFDELMDTLRALVRGEAANTTWLYGVLPPFAYSRLDMRLCENLIITLATLAYKTFGPRPSRVVCVGEALLLNWAVDTVEGLAQLEEEPFDAKRWEAFQYRVTDPLDIWLMYDPKFDGVDRLFPEELSVDTWFSTFAHVLDDVCSPLIRPPAIPCRYMRLTGEEG